MKLAGFDLSAKRSGKSSESVIPVISKKGKADLRLAEELLVALLVLARVVQRHPARLDRQARPFDLLQTVAGLGLSQLGLQRSHGGRRAVDLGRQHLAADLPHGLELPQVLLGALQVGLGLVAQRRELAAVEDGEHLAHLRHPALVGPDLLHPTAHLKGEVGLGGLDRPRVIKLGAAPVVLPPEHERPHAQQQRRKRDQDHLLPLHRPPLRVEKALNQI